MSLKPPDPNEESLRYTSLEAIKERLGIPATDTTRDADITIAGVSGEYAIDVFCGRGFPDVQDAEPPESITVVPRGVVNVALSMAIAIWKQADAPTGTAGSDAFFGTIAPGEDARALLGMSPELISFRVSWGVA